jgi:hypothetical protein
MRGLPVVFKGFVFAKSWALMSCSGVLTGVGIDELDDNAF